MCVSNFKVLEFIFLISQNVIDFMSILAMFLRFNGSKLLTLESKPMNNAVKKSVKCHGESSEFGATEALLV